MNKEWNNRITVTITFFLFFVLLYFFINLIVNSNFNNVQAVYSDTSTESIEILKNKNPIHINEIIEKNRSINIREEMLYETTELEYNTQYIDCEDLPTGTIRVKQIGVTGIQDVITIKKFNGDELISDQIVACNVKKASIDKIVEIGVGKR